MKSNSIEACSLDIALSGNSVIPAAKKQIIRKILLVFNFLHRCIYTTVERIQYFLVMTWVMIRMFNQGH